MAGGLDGCIAIAHGPYDFQIGIALKEIFSMSRKRPPFSTIRTLIINPLRSRELPYPYPVHRPGVQKPYNGVYRR